MPYRTANLIEVPQRPQILHKPLKAARKRKRKPGQEAEHSSPQDGDRLPSKRLRTSPSSCTAEERAASDISENSPDPLLYWLQTRRWPKEYFEQDSQVRADFKRGKSPEEFEKRDWLQEHFLKEPFRPMQGFPHLHHLLARKKSSSSLRRKQSGPASDAPSSNTPSDQKPRDAKSAPYQDPRYETLLSTKGSFMNESDLGITEKSKETYLNLLDAKQTVPTDSLFRDNIFKRTCQNIRNRNETRVIRDISLLIVPSAETLATYGAKHLDILIDNTNEGWNNSIPLTSTRPQPDYSVGFKREVFTKDQLNKLAPFIGDFIAGDQSFFMATYYMYFPFLTCEVKCGAAALDIADRQNAHSMTLAVKAIVELFRLVGREIELHREILAFSISHDHRSVRIYGHYPVIEEDKITFWRHPIKEFSFTSEEGKEKWTAYKFTKNVYDVWMPLHLKRICSAIDELPPDISFDLSQAASFSQSSQQSFILDEGGSQPSAVGSQEVTPTTSFTQANERASKKPRNQGAAGQQR